MKKTIKAIGFLAAFVLAMFLNTNAVESRKFNLADAISMNTANAECPWWNSDCDEEPYADEPVSYQRKCTSWIYHDDGRVEESYYWVPGGIDCVPEFGPWANCTPFDPSC